MLLVSALSGCNTYTDDGATTPTTAATQPTTESAGTTEATTETVVDAGPKSFTLVDGGDPITLDYGKYADNLSEKAMYYTGTALYRPADNGYIPDGAVSYEVSDDGLTYTFKIREGMVWSDGQPLTAQDYRFGILHRLDFNSANVSAITFYPIKGAIEYNTDAGSAEDVGISCPDEHTLVFELTYAAPTLITSLYMIYPIREDYI